MQTKINMYGEDVRGEKNKNVEDNYLVQYVKKLINAEVAIRENVDKELSENLIEEHGERVKGDIEILNILSGIYHHEDIITVSELKNESVEGWYDAPDIPLNTFFFLENNTENSITEFREHDEWATSLSAEIPSDEMRICVFIKAGHGGIDDREDGYIYVLDDRTLAEDVKSAIKEINTFKNIVSNHRENAELDHPSGSVKKKHMASNSVGTSQVEPKAITTDKLADGIVTTDKVKDGIITRAKLHADVQDELDSFREHIDNPSEELADGVVTLSKLGSDVMEEIYKIDNAFSLSEVKSIGDYEIDSGSLTLCMYGYPLHNTLYQIDNTGESAHDFDNIRDIDGVTYWFESVIAGDTAAVSAGDKVIVQFTSQKTDSGDYIAYILSRDAGDSVTKADITALQKTISAIEPHIELSDDVTISSSEADDENRELVTYLNIPAFTVQIEDMTINVPAHSNENYTINESTPRYLYCVVECDTVGNVMDYYNTAYNTDDQTAITAIGGGYKIVWLVATGYYSYEVSPDGASGSSQSNFELLCNDDSVIYLKLESQDDPLLQNLKTETKISLVAAINELVERIAALESGAGTINAVSYSNVTFSEEEPETESEENWFETTEGGESVAEETTTKVVLQDGLLKVLKESDNETTFINK